MARIEKVIYTDDVTGEESEDIMTVLLVSNGVAYECDMSPTTREAYANAIQPFLSVARRVGRANGGNVLRPAFGGAVPAQREAAKPDREQTKAVREWWARNQGKGSVPPLVERGRIPGEVMELFQTHGGRNLTDDEPKPVEAGKEARKAGTVGAEMRVTAPAFSDEPKADEPKADEPKPDTPKKAVAAKTPRARKATASVSTDDKSGGAKRTGRRAAAS